LNVQGDRRDLTILLVKICGFTSYSENNLPEKIFKILNIYLSTIIQSILDEAGLVNKIMGDTVISLFGVLPSTGYPPLQALKAAFRMLEAVSELNRSQQLARAFDISIGITSGSVALGLLGNTSKTLCAIGECIDMLTQLESQVSPREILIDDNTFARIKDLQKHFSARTFIKSGTNTPITTYSYKVGQ
jgi:class 3 adenylate cyclase